MSRVCEMLEQMEMFGDMTEKQGAGLLNPGPPQGGEGATPSVSSTGASFNSKIPGSDPGDGGATPPVPASFHHTEQVGDIVCHWHFTAP